MKKLLLCLPLLALSCTALKPGEAKNVVDAVAACVDSALATLKPPVTSDQVVEVIVLCAEQYQKLDSSADAGAE